MTTQDIVKALRCCADGPLDCEGCPICDARPAECDNLHRQAAGLIESLTAELDQLKQERDSWKYRAEAAEQDMGCMIPCYTCKARPVGEARECAECVASPLTGWKRSHYVWRGLCVENGGVGYGGQTDSV